MFTCRYGGARCFSTTAYRLKTHYDVLGVSTNSTPAEIKKRFFELSKKFHPDKTRSLTASERQKHSAHFRQIKEAYDVLSNKRSKADYDRTIGGEHQHKSYSPYQPRNGSSNLRRSRVYHNKYKARETNSASHNVFNPGHRSGSNYDVPHFDYDKHLKHQQSYETHRQKRFEEKVESTMSHKPQSPPPKVWTFGKFVGLTTAVMIIYTIWK